MASKKRRGTAAGAGWFPRRADGNRPFRPRAKASFTREHRIEIENRLPSGRTPLLISHSSYTHPAPRDDEAPGMENCPLATPFARVDLDPCRSMGKLPGCSSTAGCRSTLRPNGHAPRNASRRALATLESCGAGRPRIGGRRPLTVAFQRRWPSAGAASERKMPRNDLKHGGQAAGRGPHASDRRACAETTRGGRVDDMQGFAHHMNTTPPLTRKQSPARIRTNASNLACVFLQIAYRLRARCRKPALDTTGGPQAPERHPAPPITRSPRDSPARRRAGCCRSLPSRGTA